jgi:hypothetical protein
MGEVMRQEPWRDPSGPLEMLAKALGFDPSVLQLNESHDSLSYTDEKFSATGLNAPGDAKQIGERRADLHAALQALIEQYGPAVTFELRIRALVVLTLDEYTFAKLDRFYEAISGIDILVLFVRIGKEELLTRWNFIDPSRNLKIYLFPEALERALGSSLTDLDHDETSVLKALAEERKLVILLPKRDVVLDGDYMAVVGGDALVKWQEHVSQKPADALAKARTVYEQARDKLRWVYFELKYLTPLHLNVHCEEGASGDVRDPAANRSLVGLVYAQLVTCSLLYIAGQSRWNEAEAASEGPTNSLWQATLASDRYLANLDIGDAGTLREALTASNPVDPWKAALVIGQRGAWVYEDERHVSDRLVVLQYVIASALRDNDSSINCRELLRQAEEVSKRAEWGWEGFITDKLDKYFAQVKLLEDTIEATTKSYDEQVQNLTKALVDNMLAAVAVVVGSFIAAIFKAPFETYVFVFGSGVYFGYLLFFPIGVGLVSTWQRFTQTRAMFEKRSKDFGKRLTTDQVDQIVGETMRRRESWFKNWFTVTTLLYAIVLGMTLWAICEVPALIKNRSDRFVLRDVSVGAPNNGFIPMTIRGENFDKDKEIVVRIGNLSYTNTEGETLKVHGSTILSLAPPLQALGKITDKERRFLTVRQGTAGPIALNLPCQTGSARPPSGVAPPPPRAQP